MNTPILPPALTPYQSDNLFTPADRNYAVFVVGCLANQSLLNFDDPQLFQSLVPLLAVLLARYRIASSAGEHCPLPFDW